MNDFHCARHILLAASLLFSLTAAGFELKVEIPRLQSEFGRSRPYPILIMDKEELQWRFAQANALGDDAGRDQRVTIIQNYVKEVVDVAITRNDALQLETYATVLKDGAFALPLFTSMYPAVYKLCAVMPASEFSNSRLEYERLLMFNKQAAHQGHGHDDLKDTLPFEILARFSLYHELAHCLDETFMPKTFDYEDPHAVHLSESFAETLALLMMEAEGFREIALPRAQLRSIYSHRIGRHFAQNPQGGFGSPFFVASGAIYNLSNVLLNTPKLGPGADLVAAARAVVEEFATPPRAFTAIVRWLENAVEAETQYQDWAQSSPHLFLEAFEHLIGYRDSVPRMADEAFSGVGQHHPVVGALMTFDQGQCVAFQNKDKALFNAILRRLARDLREGLGGPEAQALRQRELQGIYLSMQQRCAAY